MNRRLQHRGNGRRRSRVAVGASTSYGGIDAGQGLGCANVSVPRVIGDAGLPGCGTQTVPGTECGFRILWKKIDLEASGTGVIEILAGRAGGFKSRYWYGFGIQTDAPATNLRFEITNIKALGEDQLIFDGTAAGSLDRGISDFVNRQDFPMPNDFKVFGAAPGQGLKISLQNLHDVAQTVYFCFWGDAADVTEG